MEYINVLSKMLTEENPESLSQDIRPLGQNSKITTLRFLGRNLNPCHIKSVTQLFSLKLCTHFLFFPCVLYVSSTWLNVI